MSVAAILPLFAATSDPEAELASLLSEESVLLSVLAVEFSFAAAEESPVLSALAVAVWESATSFAVLVGFAHTLVAEPSMRAMLAANKLLLNDFIFYAPLKNDWLPFTDHHSENSNAFIFKL